MFKSALARGEMRIIGATTLSEYKEYIAEDEAGATLRLVKVVEPSINETRRFCCLRPRLEKNYSVKI
jgi:ATP-dependent Clp protease ATP-binding subunit ClpA